MAVGIPSGRSNASGLRGRRHECEELDRVLDDVRAEHSRVLVLRGEAGVGKTALMSYLAARAGGARVVRAAGVESEMELPFASLQQLCAPLLEHREGLPEPQREALNTAFGLDDGEATDAFRVSLAALSLLADAAERQPLICLVDDAQWLDHASAQALAFVARRLLAESIGLVFATREPRSAALRDLPDLWVTGLDDAAAGAVLESATVGRLDQGVRDRIVAETRGNPLALLELPRAMTAAELAGGFALPAARSVESVVEHTFSRRFEALPPATQRLLVVAAAEPVGDANLMWRAATVLGITAEAAAPAEQAGLITLDTRVRFTHPLVRTAVYRIATVTDRRQAHRALALATDAGTDPDRRAWHRANAAAGPDESVAADLERSADRASRRGGIAAAAAFEQRAAELTPDPARRGQRALAAADAKFEAGDLDAACRLLATAELSPLDDLERAMLDRLRAQIIFARGRGRDAPPLLVSAARRLEPLDAPLARDAYVEAFGAAMAAGRLSGPVGMRQIAEAARAAPAAEPIRPVDVLLDGIATFFTEGPEEGLAALRRALAPFRDAGIRRHARVDRRLLQASPTAQAAAVHHLWDFDAWEQLSTNAVQLARDSGALAFLPIALIHRAGAEMHAGDFTHAAALIEEANTITTATGYAPVRSASLIEAAWRGDESVALHLLATAVEDATGRGEGSVLTTAGFATAVLYNGLARYDLALEAAREACAADDFTYVGWSLAELVEASARSGATEHASTALERLDERTTAAGTDWALGIRARCRALLASGDEAERLYIESVERLTKSRVVLHESRTRLVYGEWLRRENRRIDARRQLHAAHEMFTEFGAVAFAERARREIAATGETARARTVETRDDLTAQESEIARLAGEGHTNPEIGSQLFISPRTVEYHLRKVFTKLGITSRRELRRVASLTGSAPQPGRC